MRVMRVLYCVELSTTALLIVSFTGEVCLGTHVSLLNGSCNKYYFNFCTIQTKCMSQKSVTLQRIMSTLDTHKTPIHVYERRFS